MFESEQFLGTLSAGVHVDFSGLLTVRWTPICLTVDAHVGGLSHRKIELTPFHGAMFLGPREHRDIDGIFRRGYELNLSGTNLGHYGNGGGKDGDFTIYKFRQVSVLGAFDAEGLRVSIAAQTHRATEIDYGTGKKEVRENVYEPIDVRAEFVVPPACLERFIGLNVGDANWLSRFGGKPRDAL